MWMQSDQRRLYTVNICDRLAVAHLLGLFKHHNFGHKLQEMIGHPMPMPIYTPQKSCRRKCDKDIHYHTHSYENGIGDSHYGGHDDIGDGYDDDFGSYSISSGTYYDDDPGHMPRPSFKGSYKGSFKGMDRGKSSKYLMHDEPDMGEEDDAEMEGYENDDEPNRISDSNKYMSASSSFAPKSLKKYLNKWKHPKKIPIGAKLTSTQRGMNYEKSMSIPESEEPDENDNEDENGEEVEYENENENNNHELEQDETNRNKGTKLTQSELNVEESTQTYHFAQTTAKPIVRQPIKINRLNPKTKENEETRLVKTVTVPNVITTEPTINGVMKYKISKQTLKLKSYWNKIKIGRYLKLGKKNVNKKKRTIPNVSGTTNVKQEYELKSNDESTTTPANEPESTTSSYKTQQIPETFYGMVPQYSMIGGPVPPPPLPPPPLSSFPNPYYPVPNSPMMIMEQQMEAPSPQTGPIMMDPNGQYQYQYEYVPEQSSNQQQVKHVNPNVAYYNGNEFVRDEQVISSKPINTKNELPTTRPINNQPITKNE
ncbi:hypothetical protein BLOT_002606 [Blomia tropicalis]|nr:hypothetical protein BLOT_002606 [Blomia tropicalis]